MALVIMPERRIYKALPCSLCFPFSVMKVGDVVSVFSDIDGKCTRGAMEFQGNKVFVGNGIAEMKRSSIFCSDEPLK